MQWDGAAMSTKGIEQSDLEHGVKMVMNLGLSTGHADTWLQLLDEVLDQYQECASKLREYKHLDSPPGEA